MEILRRVRVRQSKAPLKFGAPITPESTVVMNAAGEPVPLSTFSRQWRLWCKANGHEGLRFHGLRHSHATLLVSHGIDVQTVAGRLGHVDGGRLVLSTYGHFAPAADRAAMEKVEQQQKTRRASR